MKMIITSITAGVLSLTAALAESWLPLFGYVLGVSHMILLDWLDGR